MYKDTGIVLMVLLALSSCNKTNESIEILARVENAFLTKKEVINRFPEYRKTDVESQVAQWVNEELLYAAGVRAGVNKDLAIVNRVEDYQKKLIGQTYLEMVLRSRVGVSTDEIKDLELRGAGNVFGYEQSGHVSSVGYHLYCKMFTDELSRSRGEEKIIDIPKIQYYGNASFSDSYVPLSQDRLYYYQRLSAAKNKEDISAVQEEISDRYGKPGPGTENLYKITEIRTAYTQTPVKNILIEKGRAVLTLVDTNQKTTNEKYVANLIKALEGAGIMFTFKQLKKESLGLDIHCDLKRGPLTILIKNAELFYYDDNNT